MTKEIWKDIVGYKNLYQVSNLGRVRSLTRKIRKRNMWGTWTTCIHKGKLLCQTPGDKDYPMVSLSKKGHVTNRSVYGLVIKTFRGPCPKGLEVRHLDGDRANSKLSNLKYGTHKENCEDTQRHGRANKGSRNGVAKLDEKIVAYARRTYKRNHPTRSISAMARKFNVSQSAMHLAVKGKKWQHVGRCVR
jgi:hypothetical protein